MPVFSKLIGTIGKTIQRSKFNIRTAVPHRQSVVIIDARDSHSLTQSQFTSVISTLSFSKTPFLLNDENKENKHNPQEVNEGVASGSGGINWSLVLSIVSVATWLGIYLSARDQTNAVSKSLQIQNDQIQFLLKHDTVNEKAEVIAEHILEYLKKAEFNFVEKQHPGGTIDNEEFTKLFTQLVEGPSLNMYSISGSYGYGKSTSIQRLMADPKYSGIPRIYVKLRDGKKENTFLEAVSAGVGLDTRNEIEEGLERAVRKYYDGQQVKPGESKKRVLIVVDDIHSIVNQESSKLVGHFCATMLKLSEAEMVKVIFVSSDEKGPKYLSKLSGFSSRLSEFTFPRLWEEKLEEKLIQNLVPTFQNSPSTPMTKQEIKSILDGVGNKLSDIDDIIREVNYAKSLHEAAKMKGEQNLKDPLQGLIDQRIQIWYSNIETTIGNINENNRSIAVSLMNKLPDPANGSSAVIANLNYPTETKKEILDKLIYANILSKVGGGNVEWSSKCVYNAFNKNLTTLDALCNNQL